MAKIYNSDCTKGLAQNAAIQQNVDRVPNELAEKIVPTFETNPALLRRDMILGFGSSTATGTITFLAPADNPVTKRTFITGFSFGYCKDAACDAGTGLISINITPKGKAANTRLIAFPVITLTAQSDTVTQTLLNPLEIEPNTSITSLTTMTAGVLSRCGTIYGYQIDNANN